MLESILDGIGLRLLGKVRFVGLLGPNGAGKTTAFYMAMGLIRPDSGHVYFHNQEVTNLPMHERARLGMGYLAQEPSIFRNLTVEENLLCILQTMQGRSLQLQLVVILSQRGESFLEEQLANL